MFLTDNDVFIIYYMNYVILTSCHKW